MNPLFGIFENSLEFRQRCWNARSENEKENMIKYAIEFDSFRKQLKLR